MPDEFKYDIFLSHSSNDSETLFHSCSNTDSQLSTMNSQPASGIDATKKLPDEGFKRLWPPLIKRSLSHGRLNVPS